jgi:hypothetical protein
VLAPIGKGLAALSRRRTRKAISTSAIVSLTLVEWSSPAARNALSPPRSWTANWVFFPRAASCLEFVGKFEEALTHQGVAGFGGEPATTFGVRPEIFSELVQIREILDHTGHNITTEPYCRVSLPATQCFCPGFLLSNASISNRFRLFAPQFHPGPV